jgi:beta-glucosidase
MLALIMSTALAAPSPRGCGEATVEKLPFCDRKLSAQARADDLVGRLTLTEKLGLTDSTHAAIPRLGVPSYTFGNDCLHSVNIRLSDVGVGPKAGSTIFPQPLAWAATFDEELVREIGTAMATEARAFSNYGTLRGVNSGFQSCWAPNMNILRDPRWGRGSETFGEDPVLTSNITTAFVGGLQGSQQDQVSVAAVCKHFTAYSLEEADGEMRFYFNAKVTKQDLTDTYLPAFQACVAANARGIMCSYNQVNGTPMCSNAELLEGTLRAQWGFRGHVVSDCSAVDNIAKLQKLGTPPEVAARALNAGLDQNCGVGFHVLNESIAQGLVEEQVLNRAISRTLRTRFELGQFDPFGSSPLDKIGYDEVGSDAHMQLALRTARESIVLLKNEGELLPLKRSSVQKATAPMTVAVIGPTADDAQLLLGSYHGMPAFGLENVSTPLRALQAQLGKNILYAGGCNVVVGDGAWGFGDALEAAEAADVAVVFVGSSSKGNEVLDGQSHNYFDTVEKESMDRREISLPGLQEDLVQAIAARTSTPIVLVLINGGPQAVEWAAASDRVGAIVQVTYPGQRGGEAIAQVLLGDHSPSGRLPVTIYHSNYTRLIANTDMRMRVWPGRTHRFLQVPPLFPFGFGLSYTTFIHSQLEVSPASAPAGVPRTVSLTVHNVGSMASDEVVLLFVRATSLTPGSQLEPPQRTLGAFRRVRGVPARGSVRVAVTLRAEQLRLADTQGRWVSPSGVWEVFTSTPSCDEHEHRHRRSRVPGMVGEEERLLCASRATLRVVG